MNNENKKFLIVIVGPTAVGKTTASIQLAQRLNGEIVSADSRLFYRGMDIGTAKPTPAEMAGIRHHLINVADPDEVWSLAVFQQNAYRAIDDNLKRAKHPLLVGGTGQYIRSIIEGWQIPPQTPDYGLRDVLTHWADEIGAEALYERLERLDPAAASKIDYRNLRRTVRALEVILNTGERFSEQSLKKGCRYSLIILGLQRPRDELYGRIDQRVDQMIAQGLVEEVQGLLSDGYSPDLPTMSAIGYGEIIAYIQGKYSLAEAIRLIKRNTRVFVRRQANWYKPDDPRITWLEASEFDVDEMENIIRRQMNDPTK